MKDTSIVIASPTVENSAALNTRIEETVQMSSYQIKKKFELERRNSMEEFNNLGTILAEMEEKNQTIRKRIQGEMETHLIGKACLILGEIDDYIEIGAEDTYYDDNRSVEVLREDIAKSIVEVSWPSFTKGDIKHSQQVFARGSINFFGSTDDRYDQFEEENCVFSPKSICKQFALTNEEHAHFVEYYKVEDTRHEVNIRVNELDMKLKNLGSLTEDIRYAMIAEKAKANNDTTSLDLAAQIADAYVNGTDPSTLLLGNKV